MHSSARWAWRAQLDQHDDALMDAILDEIEAL
jgi:hypothetical protein